jgi:hypothetical protein
LGRLHANARKLMKRQRDALAGKPLAVFAMGPRTLSDNDMAGARVGRMSGLIEEVRVRVERDAWTAMTEDPADLGHVDAKVDDQVARERVP